MTDTKGRPTSKAEALIDGLMALHPKGYDLSLGRIRRLLDRLGNPEAKLPPVVHVAGTNGKGSTIAFIRAILEASGWQVHVHTSPHLVHWHERYRVGGAIVSDAMLADAITRVADANDGEAITVFELLTAVGFVLFSEQPADVVLMEVGLGGRLDCTNVVPDKALTVITPIGMDHEAHLGSTLSAIAAEKAGILQRGTPLVVATQADEALDVIEAAAARLGIEPVVAGRDYLAQAEGGGMTFQELTPDGEGRLYDLPLPALAGPHQIANAATAIAACRTLSRTLARPLPNDAFERGLRAVEWPGRLQRLSSGPLLAGAPVGTEVWVDGGHNAHAACAVTQHMAALADRAPRPLFLVVGMLNTKVPTDFLAQFAGLVRHVFAVPLATTDAGLAPHELARHARAAGLSAEPAASAREAVATIYRDWPFEPGGQGVGPRILVTGSLYLAGETLAALETASSTT